MNGKAIQTMTQMFGLVRMMSPTITGIRGGITASCTMETGSVLMIMGNPQISKIPQIMKDIYLGKMVIQKGAKHLKLQV